MPIGNVAFRIQHVDGVVAYALYKHPELTFRVGNDVVAGLLIRDIADGSSESLDFAAIIFHRTHGKHGPELRTIFAVEPAMGLVLPLMGCNFQTGFDASCAITDFGKKIGIASPYQLSIGVTRELRGRGIGDDDLPRGMQHQKDAAPHSPDESRMK